jgi:hypothetical protein
MHPLLGLGLFAGILAWLFSEDEDSVMPAVQKQFEDFHSAIKLDGDDENAKLRQKRDILVKALISKLDDEVPPFDVFNQGSYSMFTGVVPVDGNYDIDVGLVFDCKQDKYPDPVVLKKIVRDALDSNFRTVAIRRPCVTVDYLVDGVPEYHVDLAIYVKRDDDMLDIAKGKENSAAEFRVWEVSDPQKLTELIRTAFTDANELAQYRRCIRYLKRWRHVQFRNGGAPLSIALTVAARDWFQPNFSTAGKPLDLLAMLDWTEAMLDSFESVYTTEDGIHSRLKVLLPVEPYGDLMAGMTKVQMDNFMERLQSLREALIAAESEDLPEDACKILNKQFGEDFRVPEKPETAKAVAAPVINTGSSA